MPVPTASFKSFELWIDSNKRTKAKTPEPPLPHPAPPSPPSGSTSPPTTPPSEAATLKSTLNRWVADPKTRIIGVRAVGGTGKTALIGQWLKETDGWREKRTFDGLFAWSFYSNRDVSEFLEALLKWGHEALGAKATPERKEDHLFAALNLIETQPLVVVLDGLEVIQRGDEETGPKKEFGSFLSLDLCDFLGTACRASHDSLFILTSRFVFADLARFRGRGFHDLELTGLTPRQGAAMLRRRDVLGDLSEREEIVRQLEGHPLGLRLFAESLMPEQRLHPLEAFRKGFGFAALPAGTLLADKLRRLLEFYAKTLTSTQSRLLQIVALFQTAVAAATVVRLTEGLFCEEENPLPKGYDLAGEMRNLAGRHILSEEPTDEGTGYACHPILRDHFRALLLGGGGTGKRAADLLAGAPSGDKPRTVKEIEPVLLAIDLLLDAGEFKAADELYEGRLRPDGRSCFFSIPAPAEGTACALAFVRDEGRRARCEEILGKHRMGFYLNGVALFAGNAGEFDVATEYRQLDVAVARELGGAKEFCICLRNEAELLTILGRLSDAIRSVEEAVTIADQLGDVDQVEYNHAYRAWADSFLGEIRPAAGGFALANELEKANDPDGVQLYSTRGIRWAELLLRTGHVLRAKMITLANLAIGEQSHWNQTVAQCHWIIGSCALTAGRLDEAGEHLRQAEEVFHQARMIYELACVHLTAGELSLARKNTDSAIDRAERALSLAIRGMKLVHADALVLRGKGRFLSTAPDIEGALDDAREALSIAKECGYAWAERDAHALHSEALAARGDKPGAAKHAKFAEALAKKLTLTEADLANAEHKAKEWLAANRSRFKNLEGKPL